MARASFSNGSVLFVVVMVVSLAVLVVSGQEMAPAPSPSQVTGAGFSGSVSGAFVAVSLAVSIVGLLKM